MGASTGALAAVSKQRQPQILSGKTFNLTIDEQRVNFTGPPRTATTVNGSLPAPLLRWKEGDTITLHVTNKLAESTSIHWHGLILPRKHTVTVQPGSRISYRVNADARGGWAYAVSHARYVPHR